MTTPNLSSVQMEQAHAFARRFSRTALIGVKDSLGLSTMPVLSGLVLGFMRFDASSDSERSRITEGHYRDVLSAYGRKMEATSGKQFPYAGNGTAVIPVHGSLLNRYNFASPWATGYNAIRSMMNAALADPDVTRIVLDVNSPGGQAAGCFELCEDIRAARAVKPVHAVVDAGAFSAAYAIASAATDITVTPSGEVGSIGVVSMHMNLGPLLEQVGVDISFIFAGKHKVDGNPFEALPDDVRANIQADVDRFYGRFVATVAAGRDGKITEQGARDTEAACFDAQTAMTLGLVDSIKSADAALASFEANTAGIALHASDESATLNDTKDTTTMTDLAAALAADRARINTILNCEEAKGREGLARHLATETDMSVEAATAALKASPKAEATSGGGSPLDRAMDRVSQPNVGADGPAAGAGDSADPDSPKAKADAIWGAYTKAGGASRVTKAGKVH